MLQSQHEPDGHRGVVPKQQHNPLLQRHPVLVPLILLSGSIIIGAASFFTDSLFPILVFIGFPSALVCLLLACVLGTCGILVGIIGILERVDHYCLPAAMFPKSKEHSYD